MPVLGLGTWKSKPDAVGAAVEYALCEASYDHIDCASIYRNEDEIGRSLKNVFESGKRKREDVFINSKLWNTDHKRGAVKAACQATLSDLNLKYLDLYLMHWGIAIPPNENNRQHYGRLEEQLDENDYLILDKISVRETWEAMEELVSAGLVKAIGVANFTAPQLVDLLTYAKVKPAMNQIELHPYLQQTRLIEFCKSQDIVVTAYSPLGSPGNYRGSGLPVLVEDETIAEIAKNHGKSPAQILIRWAIQRGTVVIPKSVTPERIKENTDVFGFELSDDEMKKVAGLDRNVRFVDPYSWWKIPYFG